MGTPTAKRLLHFILFMLPMPVVQAQPDHQQERRIHQILQTYHQLGLFNGNALIAEKDHILFKRSYGFADAATGRRLTDETKFNIYSVTKPFTATLILQLIGEDKLQLADRLTRFFPDLPYADSITIEHLLTHTSGIFAYNNDFSMPVHAEAAMIGWLQKKNLDFTPGSQFRYCNTGYFLLGFIIEKITGLTYEEAVQQYILTPSGMNDTGPDLRKIPVNQQAEGYQYLTARDHETAPVWDYNELYAAGGLYATTQDLFRFHQALRGNGILQPSLSHSAYTPYKKNYGYGWFIDSLHGHKIVSHSGGATGFRSYLIRDITDDRCIVLLCNSETSDIVAIRNKLLDELSGRSYTLPSVPALSATQLSAYQGAYQLTPSMTVYIHREKGQLMATPNRQSAHMLLAAGQDSFQIEAINATFRFKHYRKGAYDTLYFSQKGQSVSAARLPATWGIAGSATPNGWNGPDIILTQNNHRYTISHIALKDGVIKFRYNNDWVLNYGWDKVKNRLIKAGDDIPVAAGNYNITLDLTNPDRATWKLVRNK